MLDRCQSAPATLKKAASPELGRHRLPQSLSAAEVPPLPPTPRPPSQPSAELVPPASLQPGAVSDDTSTWTPPDLDEDSPVQTMEEEEADPCPVEMECPPAPEAAASPEVEAVPSLAAALIELHELLVSNTRTQAPDRSASCSPPHQPAPGQDHVRPSPEAAELETTMGGAIPAQVDQATELDVRDGCPPGGPSSQQPGDREQKATEAPSGLLERPASAEPRQPAAVTSDPSLLQLEETSLSPLPMVVDSPGGVSPKSPSQPPLNPPGAPPTVPEPPRTSLSSPNPSGTLPAPLNPPENTLPPSQPLIDQFPAEHIQQIQAAGFSAVEAAEALERAHGVVELALLVLLARSITVPT